MPPQFSDCTRGAACVNPIHLPGCKGLVALLAAHKEERAIYYASLPVKKTFG